MHYVLEAETIVKSYGLRKILTDVYLKLCTGEIIGLLGRNGSGKSSLMKIIFGTLAAENKSIKINDQIFNKPYIEKNLISYLPQMSFLPKSITVQNAVRLYFDDEKIISDDVILSKVRGAKISNLSGGEQRYLEIKMLLFSKSKFVFLDEPFSGASPILKEEIKKLIKQQSPSKGIILTDHDFRNVLDVSNKQCLLVDGALKKINSDSELTFWGYVY